MCLVCSGGVCVRVDLFLCCLFEDIMPLVDNSELQQQDERRHNVVEVVFAVVVASEGRAVQQDIATELMCRINRVTTEILNLPFKELHPHHSKDIIHHLQGVRERY